MDHLDAVGCPAKEPEKRGRGNPYPKRGEIKEKVMVDVYRWLVASPSFLLSVVSLASQVLEATEMDQVHVSPRRKARGNPYPRRGQIKEKIFEDIFKLIPEAITG